MARGYLANWLATPPLVFRFQFNPSMLQDKKSWKYEPANEKEQWGFDQTEAQTGFFGDIKGFIDDVKEWGSLLTQTRHLEPKEGGQRTIAIEFDLDARVTGEGITPDTANPYGGTIAPDLAILRSFVNPTPDLFSYIDALSQSTITFKELVKKPAECSLIFGGMNIDCVMESLNIKITAFADDHEPQRATVSVTLKEQTKSFGPIIETATRIANVSKSLTRDGFWDEDYVNVIPGVQAIQHLFE